MWTKQLRLIGFVVILVCGPAQAQDPLSAIDWLSDSLAIPYDSTPSDNTLSNRSALPADVSVSDIDSLSPDGVGLLPSSVTGLPRDLWGHSRSTDLAGRFRAERPDMLPAMQDLLYTLLLAELDPPVDSGGNSSLFLARLDYLLTLGALDQAQSLLALSGQDQAELFRRAFDVALLTHSEDQACGTLRSTPALSPTFPARVFCLARGGDWDAAALSLETGRALGYLSEFEDAILARFLDPLLFENDPMPAAPPRPSPLVFRMMEAIGEPIATANLPRAFAHADLNSNTGWKAQIEAAERLARSGAVDANLLFGYYSERKPAASGGVWDRVLAVQNLQEALQESDLVAVATALPIAWEEMSNAELEIPFVQMIAHKLKGLELNLNDPNIALEIALLSDEYEEIAIAHLPQNDQQTLITAVARGQPGAVFADDPISAAIQDGFRANGIPVRLQSLTGNNRLGEAILRSIELFSNGAKGELDELTDSLAFFRAVGLEDVARRASLQLLLLERRG